MDFGVVVIHYRQPGAIEGLLKQLREWSALPELIVIVDNGGQGPELQSAVQRVQDQLPELPPVEIFDAPGNPGYAVAANVGLTRLRQAGARMAMVLTQEARLAATSAEQLAAAVRDDPEVAIAAPILEYASAPGTVFSSGGVLGRRGLTEHRDQGRAREADFTPVRTVDWADGAVLMVDLAAAAEVGDMDPAYFLYVEEIDLQLALRRAGYRTVIVPTATGYQDPGRYPPYLRYRNSSYLTAKFSDELRPWPWRREMAVDVVKRMAGRYPDFTVSGAMRGVLDARRGNMGPTDPHSWPGSGESLTIVTEFEPRYLHTGVAARLGHMLGTVPDATVCSLNQGPRDQVTLSDRLAAVRRFRPPAGSDRLVVLALGSPPMMRLARQLHGRGENVRVDLCDSTILQWRARRSAADAKLVAVGAWMFAEHLAGPTLPVSYITDRDATADQRLNRLRDVRILGPKAPAALSELEPFRWPAERIVLYGDFGSFHNADGLAQLRLAVEQVPDGLPVQLFGPQAPPEKLPVGMEYRGWADSSAQVLSGDTVAFISNRAGSGIPNKLVEALAAGRPVIAHTDLKALGHALTNPGAIYWYDDPVSLAAILRTLKTRSAVAA